MMLKTSVVIITLNAEPRIRRVLSSVPFADEIIVVDCGSADSTVDICREAGARVFERAWQGYGAQKNYGIDKASGAWILSLDADEVVSPALAKEICALDDSPAFAGYMIPRLNYYFGRPLRHGGQYPDYQLRLFRKSAGRFNDRVIHEAAVVSGPVGRLAGELLHYTYDTIEEYFNKFNRYTSLSAERLAAAGKKVSSFRLAAALLTGPLYNFILRYFFRLGFLDGMPGLFAAFFSSFAKIVSLAKYWEKERKDTPDPQ